MIKKITLKKNLTQVIIKKTLNKFSFGLLFLKQPPLFFSGYKLFITKNALKTVLLVNIFNRYTVHFPLNFYFSNNFLLITDLLQKNLQNIVILKIKNKFINNRLITRNFFSKTANMFISFNASLFI